MEMTVNSAMVKVAEWNDNDGLVPIPRVHQQIKPIPIGHVKNKTFIINSILVRNTDSDNEKSQNLVLSVILTIIPYNLLDDMKNLYKIIFQISDEIRGVFGNITS